jgi:xanthine dehydrogenase molybdopterin-binding subunit B
LAHGRVRYAGQPIAVVVAEAPEAAEALAVIEHDRFDRTLRTGSRFVPDPIA